MPCLHFQSPQFNGDVIFQFRSHEHAYQPRNVQVLLCGKDSLDQKVGKVLVHKFDSEEEGLVGASAKNPQNLDNPINHSRPVRLLNLVPFFFVIYLEVSPPLIISLA